MNVPSLEKLLQDELVLVLGAGASVDYGFPTWKDLRRSLIEKLSCNDFESEVGCLLAKKWLDEFKNKQDQTLDSIISESYRNIIERNWISNIVMRLLSECERKDKENSEKKWICLFADKFVELLDAELLKDDSGQNALNLLANFKVVSLNYERCFSYHFFPKIYAFFAKKSFADKDFLLTNREEVSGFFKIYQPHGSIGYLTLEEYVFYENNLLIGSHDVNKFTQNRTAVSTDVYRMPKIGCEYGGNINKANHIEFVGEGGANNYDSINKSINANNCLIIGLSRAGLKGCQINWDKFENIYYSERKPKENKYKKFTSLASNNEGFASASEIIKSINTN